MLKKNKIFQQVLSLQKLKMQDFVILEQGEGARKIQDINLQSDEVSRKNRFPQPCFWKCQRIEVHP